MPEENLNIYPNRAAKVRGNIKRLVEEQGYSFARDLQSITRRQLYRIHSGQSDVTVGKLQKIADEIGVDLLDFFK